MSDDPIMDAVRASNRRVAADMEQRALDDILGNPPPWSTCVLCTEPIGHYDPWVQFNPDQTVHHECSLRSVLGGIGHQLAHEWWCKQQHDPDAGLTYRQSAALVKVLVELLGVDEVARRGATT